MDDDDGDIDDIEFDIGDDGEPSQYQSADIDERRRQWCLEFVGERCGGTDHKPLITAAGLVERYLRGNMPTEV